VFREQGICFDCVAGTSVGALNAAIWSTGSFEKGNRLWQDLSFQTVLPVRIRHPKLPSAIYYLDGAIRVTLRMLVATWAGVPHPLRRFCALINSALFVGPLTLIVTLLTYLSNPHMHLAAIMSGLLAFGILYFGQIDESHSMLEVSQFNCIYSDIRRYSHSNIFVYINY